jgi:hypothetical protein
MLHFDLEQIRLRENSQDGDIIQYCLYLSDGEPVAKLEFDICKKPRKIYIERLKVKQKHQHTNKHYGSIILDYFLNRMIHNLSEDYKTIYLAAYPFDMSYWRIIKKYPEFVDLDKLVKFFNSKYPNVDSLDKINKNMVDDNENELYGNVYFGFEDAARKEFDLLEKFYQRFGFVTTGITAGTAYMKRTNKIIPVPGINYTTGKLGSESHAKDF